MTLGIDPSHIDQIVIEVLAQLRERSGSAREEAKKTFETIRPSTAVQSSSEAAPLEFTETIITEALLKARVRAGVVIRVLPKAILTPSARDYIRTHRIKLNTDQDHSTSKSTQTNNPLGIVIASHLPDVVQSFLADIRKQWKAKWAVELASGSAEVIERAIGVICRGESRQVLMLARRPHRIACLINRNSKCRAAVVQDGSSVRQVRGELAANVICVNLERPTFVGLREVLMAATETAALVEHRREEE